MFAGFKPLKPLFHVESDRLNDEQKYWNRLKEVSVFQENGNITSTDFSPVDPYHVATTYSNALAIYETNTCNPIANYTKVKSALHCVSYRADGRILAVGAHDGTIRVLRITSEKSVNKCSLHPVQNFPKAHRHAINCIAFAPPAGVNFASLADNGAVRLWDLADARGIEAQPLWSVDNAHSDQARSGVFAVRNPNLLVTGAYDHKIKLWDIRCDANDSPKLNIDHGCPVEKVLLFPNETILASAGGTTIKLWDIAAGGKLIHTMENHFKTVTSMCFTTNRTYLLSGGLDRQINLFRCNSGDFALVKSWKVAAPVFSLSMSSDDSRMAFGMSNLLSIYRRKSEKEILDAAVQNGYPNSEMTAAVGLLNGTADSLKRKRPAKFSLPAFIDPNDTSKPTRRVAAPQVLQRQRPEDGKAPKVTVVELFARHADQLKMGRMDKLLRDRRYREFFSSAITCCGLNRNHPEFAVAALHQLRIRQKIPLALSGHPENVLCNFLRFLELNLFKTPFFDVLFDVFNVFLKVYSEKQLSTNFIEAIEQLKEKIFTEIETQLELSKCLGIMSMISYRPTDSDSNDNTIVIDADRATQTVKTVIWAF